MTTCTHEIEQAACRETCARCGHTCAVHRGELGGRGVGGAACWECRAGACPAWMDRVGVALLDAGVTLDIDDRAAAARRYTVLVRSWGKVVGEICLAPGRAHDEVMVERAVLKRPARGKGIAAEVYAELARRLQPYVLTSGRHLTPPARAVWAGQVARGYAVELKTHVRLERPPARPAGWRNGDDEERSVAPPLPPGPKPPAIERPPEPGPELASLAARAGLQALPYPQPQPVTINVAGALASGPDELAAAIAEKLRAARPQLQVLQGSFGESPAATVVQAALEPTADYHLVEKRGWFWRALNLLVVAITLGRNRRFLTDYVTTIGPWIAVPVGVEPSPGLVVHERTHVDQFRRLGGGSAVLGILPMALLYLLLPLPIGFAWFRWRFEREAYVAGWSAELGRLAGAARVCRRAELIEHGVEQMTTGAYAWTWPFPRAVRRWFEAHV